MKPYNSHFLGFDFINKDAGKNYMPPLEYAQHVTQIEEIHQCPLCGSQRYIVIGKFQIDALVDQWVERYGFNPIPDVYKGKILEKRRCCECDLSYYNYHLHDDEDLYKRLAKTHYYPTFRSEYGVATEILQELKLQTLLEIGCGNGAFLDRIQHMIPMVMGSEYNTDAAKECQQRGLKVTTEDISTINIPIDVVCHFEVLEHVFDTKKLMHDTLWLLNPGGKLIIGTPDPDGILSVNGTGVLHLPPHHQFDFSKQTFEWLAGKYNLNLVDYRKTELTYHHYANYVKNLTGMPLTQPDVVGFYETQKKYTNHSHVVVFEKK